MGIRRFHRQRLDGRRTYSRPAPHGDRQQGRLPAVGKCGHGYAHARSPVLRKGDRTGQRGRSVRERRQPRLPENPDREVQTGAVRESLHRHGADLKKRLYRETPGHRLRGGRQIRRTADQRRDSPARRVQSHAGFGNRNQRRQPDHLGRLGPAPARRERDDHSGRTRRAVAGLEIHLYRPRVEHPQNEPVQSGRSRLGRAEIGSGHRRNRRTFAAQQLGRQDLRRGLRPVGHRAGGTQPATRPAYYRNGNSHHRGVDQRPPTGRGMDRPTRRGADRGLGAGQLRPCRSP